ncbi:MAG: response regulator [Saprospiraceae bacterium]|nr:response regulator [Pyrinomonadaceae bacterium]
MRLEFEPNPSVVPFVEADAAESVNPVRSHEADENLREGIKAAQAGNRVKARVSLLRAAELDATNESTWLWLASISEYPEELLVFLNNVLEINPDNPRALEWTAATKSLLAKNLVQRGIDAAEAKQPDAAIQYFNQALEHDQQNSMAWLWMASLSDSNEGKMAYLEKVLNIEPDNEAANAAYRAARFDANQKLLAEARSAAVSGKVGEANDLIDAILAETPDSEEAWVLRSHLADGFEEKIRSFEQVLAINPDNAAARSGLDSLRSIMDAVAPAAVEAAVEEPIESETVEASATEDHSIHETAVNDRQPTEELQFPEGISEEVQLDMMMSSSNIGPDAFAQTFHFSSFEDLINEEKVVEFTEESAEEELASADEAVSSYVEPAEDNSSDSPVVEFAEDPSDDELMANEDDTVAQYAAPVEVSEESSFESLSDEDEPQSFESAEIHQTVADEVPAAEFSTDNVSEVSAPEMPEFVAEEVHPSWEDSIADAPMAFAQAPDEALESNNDPVSEFRASFDETDDQPVGLRFFEDSIPMPYAELPEGGEMTMASINPYETVVFARKIESDSPASMAPCPFCTAVNDAQAFICQGCMAMLTLSDLEMLMANQHADKFILRDAVEKMESEKTSRDFTEAELTMLGIGHLNLRNLQRGYSYLHEASQVNPNNVVLSSQVNALLIRLEEIKKQEEVNEAMPKGKTILVVDDSPTVRKLIAGKLEKCGHDVFCSNDGVEAMERLQDLTPDLILLDITMPRMDGYQVCKMIRANDMTKDVPVVMISGKDGFFDKVRGRMAGTSGYITKPFGPETLMKAVETYLKSEA